MIISITNNDFLTPGPDAAGRILSNLNNYYKNTL